MSYSSNALYTIFSACMTIDDIRQSLEFGRGSEKHNSANQILQDAGLASYHTVEGNHGRDYARLEPTELGQELNKIKHELWAIKNRLEQVGLQIAKKTPLPLPLSDKKR